MSTNDKYISRSLRFVDSNGEERNVLDIDVLLMGKPIVILGEPGMGKSMLLAKLADIAGVRFLTAKEFLRKATDNSDASNELVIIDAIDELSAANETDPLNRVLTQLNKNGSPEFILSCRSSEWKDVVDLRDITQDYGVKPNLLELTPLTEIEAKVYLESRITGAESNYDELLTDLMSAGAGDFFGNPLLLQLIAQLVKETPQIPKSRADLFTRACESIWKEHDRARPQARLNKITSDSALDAAGAICATWILTSIDAISSAVSIDVDTDDCALIDVAQLPFATEVNSIIDSKLFKQLKTGQSGRFVPIHRTIAEFLGAR
jgi:predicted NACHT family NTPase